MLILRNKQDGVTMIELLIGMVIMGILLAIGAPALSTWIQNGKIRAAAGAIQDGLQLARTEAVRRNATVRFELTNSITNACARSLTSSNWVVSQSDAIGACASTPSDTAAAPDPLIIQTRSSTEGNTTTVTVAAGQSPVAFNGLGRQVSVTNNDATTTPSPPANINIDITNPVGGTCKASGGPMTCLRVAVSSGGEIHMCDPAYSQATNPKGC